MSLPRTRRNGRPQDLGNQIAYLPISGQPPEPQLPGIRREHFLPSTNHEAGDRWALVRSLFPNALIGQGERRGSFVKPRHYATAVFRSRWLAHLGEVWVLVSDGEQIYCRTEPLWQEERSAGGLRTSSWVAFYICGTSDASGILLLHCSLSGFFLFTVGGLFFVDWLISEIILGVIKYYQIY